MRWTLPCLVVPLVLTLACADTRMPVEPAADLPFAASVDPGIGTLSAPVFGLGTSPDGSLLAAETYAGITEIRKGSTSPVVALGGVSDVAPLGRGALLALTGALLGPNHPQGQRLFRISQGHLREIADLGAYEEIVNPDQVWNDGPPDSNPFNLVEMGGGRALVADAAANAVLYVDTKGSIDWVAVLTPQLVPTDPFKDLIGCPGSGAPECDLPVAFPAQPVSTSIAVGPDGAYYAGELTGFPGSPGVSRIWRIEPGSRHVLCPSAACTQVAGGLTSVMDLAFGNDGLLYVVEFDALGWLAVDLASGGGPLGPVAGGNVKACDVGTGICTVVASGLSLPTAVTIGRDGRVWVAENSAIPGTATISPIN